MEDADDNGAMNSEPLDSVEDDNMQTTSCTTDDQDKILDPNDMGSPQDSSVSW